MLKKVEEVREIAEKHGFNLYDDKKCAECKGKHCCQHFPCFYAPSDFEVLVSSKYTDEEKILLMTEEIRKGKIAIDMIWFKDQYLGPLNPFTKKPDIYKICDNDGFLFLRPARAKEGSVVDLQYFIDREKEDYPCINWSAEKGCSLSKEERPYTGSLLIPKERGCLDLVNYEEFVIAWAEYKVFMYYLYKTCKDFTIKL